MPAQQTTSPVHPSLRASPSDPTAASTSKSARLPLHNYSSRQPA